MHSILTGDNPFAEYKQKKLVEAMRPINEVSMSDAWKTATTIFTLGSEKVVEWSINSFKKLVDVFDLDIDWSEVGTDLKKLFEKVVDKMSFKKMGKDIQIVGNNKTTGDIAHWLKTIEETSDDREARIAQSFIDGNVAGYDIVGSTRKTKWKDILATLAIMMGADLALGGALTATALNVILWMLGYMAGLGFTLSSAAASGVILAGNTLFFTPFMPVILIVGGVVYFLRKD